jgi:energy-coupling factor transporter transmembrane protein EcfT
MFISTVFIVSLISAILTGIVAALFFTSFMLLIAVCILVPTIFLSSIGAVSLYVWGLIGYFLLNVFSKGKAPGAIGNRFQVNISRPTDEKTDGPGDSMRLGENGDDETLLDKNGIVNGGGDHSIPPDVNGRGMNH